MNSIIQIFKPKPKEVKSKQDFKRLVRHLRVKKINTPLTIEFENETSGFKPQKVWYSDQGEHWEGWLSGYDGSGYYNRKNSDRDPEFIYNHIMCPQMFLWLAEALLVDKETVYTAKTNASRYNNYQSQCAVIRKYISWDTITKRLALK